MQRRLLEALVNTTGMRTERLFTEPKTIQGARHHDIVHGGDSEEYAVPKYLASRNQGADTQHMPQVWNDDAQKRVHRDRPLTDVAGATYRGVTYDNYYHDPSSEKPRRVLDGAKLRARRRSRVAAEIKAMRKRGGSAARAPDVVALAREFAASAKK